MPPSPVPICKPLRPTAFWRRLAGVLLLGCVAAGAAAEERVEDLDQVEAEAERQEAIEHNVSRAEAAWKSGNHEEVLARAERLTSLAPELPLVDRLAARTLMRVGRYEEAEARLDAAAGRHPTDRELRLARYRLLRTLSRHPEAEALALEHLAAAPDDAPALALLGWALAETGKPADAFKALEKVVKGWKPGTSSPDDVPWVAEAALAATWLDPRPSTDLAQDALALLEKYVAAHPDDQDALFQMAEMFRADGGARGQSLARKHFRRLLGDNASHPDVRVSLAHIHLVFWEQAGALAELRRALDINPNHPGALALRAAIHVGNGDYEQAERDLARAQEVVPRDVEARSVAAALHFIRGNMERFEEIVAAALADNPRASRVHVRTAQLVGERQRRYDIAVRLARRAVEVDPMNPEAHDVLGEALMNVGETDAALVAFHEARRASKRYASVRRDNWIRVLEGVLPDLVTVETPHFLIRMPRTEAAIMRHYLPQLLEEAHKELGTKYGFETETPIYVDAFARNDDFSVRSIGTPGLPALGVCFGRVITLLGPTALPLGAFSWSRTAWHEYAHVVTVQMSEGQVPRWLTEGLSVFEEVQKKPLWGRDMERELYDRYHNDRLLRMSAINSAFQGPDIMFAYYQGGLIAEQLLENRGFDVIPALLREFAKDRPTEAAFRSVLGVELDDYDRTFREFVAKRIQSFCLVPRWDDASRAEAKARTQKEPGDGQAWIRLAWAEAQRGRELDAGAALAKAKALLPEDPHVLLLLGRMAAEGERPDLADGYFAAVLAAGHDDYEMRLYLAKRAQGRDANPTAAIEHLEAAKRCYPGDIGRNNPYKQLARLYRGSGKLEQSVAELEAFARVAPEDYEVRHELRSHYALQKDWTALARVCEEMVDISPLGIGAEAQSGKARPDLDLHRLYAQALVELGRPEEALRERRVQVEMGWQLPEEARLAAGSLEDLLQLGEALLAAGLAEEALESAVSALRLSPAEPRALMLKEQAMQAGRQR